VYRASASARNLGVSPLVIGFTIVGFGTSAPEMVVSAVAALQGNPGLGDGNAIGSNTANIGLILGCAALAQPLAVKSETLRREYPLMFAVMLFTILLMLDLSLSRLDGMLLLAGLVGLTILVVRLGLRQNRAFHYGIRLPRGGQGQPVGGGPVAVRVPGVSARALPQPSVTDAASSQVRPASFSHR